MEDVEKSLVNDSSKPSKEVCIPLLEQGAIARDDQTNSLTLSWRDVSFQVSLSAKCCLSLPNKIKRPNSSNLQILKAQSGQLTSGQLIGIIGPSGAGKSTLLNCLTGRYKEKDGVSGSIDISGRTTDGIDIAFIPQHEALFGCFTIRETLLFASRVKNKDVVVDNGHKVFDHDKAVNTLITALKLESCSDTYIKNCSGGEVKRVGIGVEIISSPDIIVLDEPTTGLDSSSAVQCINILKCLAGRSENPPAILATIHQPSRRILLTFDLIYLLSKDGECFYFGPPGHFKTFAECIGLQVPVDSNPAEVAIEVASGEYGEEIVDKCSTLSREATKILQQNDNNIDINEDNVIWTIKMKETITSPDFDLKNTFLLLVRNWLKILRDPKQLYLRIFQNVAIALLVSFLWSGNVGKENGCWYDFFNAKRFNNGSSTNADKSHYIDMISQINSNSSLLFAMLIYVLMVSTMSTVLSFPSETLVILKEMKNSWYSCCSYYISKVVAEIPIVTFMILLISVIYYPLTGQIAVWWRFSIVFLVTTVMGDICQSFGMLFGTIFSHDQMSALFSGVAAGFPPILFGGFVVRIQSVNQLLKPFAYLSYVKYAFESIIIAIYGFDRCTEKINYKMLKSVEVPNSRNPITVLGSLVSSFGVTSKNAGLFASLLNVNATCMESVINGTIAFLGQDKEQTTSVEHHTFVDQESSYVLSYFNLKDDMLHGNILTLIAYAIVLKILTFLVLKHKAR